MARTSRIEEDARAFDVAVVHGDAPSLSAATWLPAGHRLSRARLRHVRQSECVLVTQESVSVGLAAYRHAESDVRVVHELLVDKTLLLAEAARVTDALIAALELLACEDGVARLMFLVYHDAPMARFDAHGYSRVIVAAGGAWVQKRLEGLTWSHQASRWRC